MWIKNEIDSSTIEFKNEERTIKVPKLIGEIYEIYDILSVGGYGVILKARNKKLNCREVLIKTSLYDDINELVNNKYDESRKEIILKRRNNLRIEFDRLIRFRRGGESRMPSAIDIIEDYSPQLYGPHTDKITGETFYLEEFKNDEVYVVMQRIDGTNLGDYISKGIDNILKERQYDTIHLWEKDVLEYMKEVATMFENFHRRIYLPQDKNYYFYYIYQDLKPHNIMITYDKFITLIDFGGLLMVGYENGKTYSNYKNQGIPGCGTYGYMPREMKDSVVTLDYRADIYTIGATIYSLLTGENPLKDLKGSVERISIDKLEKMGYTDRTISLVKKAVSYDREDRHTSVRYLLNEMRTCLGKLNSLINKG